jgi:hypothetical protein
MTEVVVCWNCCVELHLGPGPVPPPSRHSHKKKGLLGVLEKGSGRAGPGPVPFPSALNYVLKLPPSNPWTEAANLCTDCAPLLTQIYKCVQMINI